MSLATAVMIGVSSVRSIDRRQGRPGEWRRSATRSIASVAEPPLPSASSLPPASKRRRRSAAAASRTSRLSPSVCLRSSPISLDFISTDAAHVGEHRLEVVLALPEKRIEEARRPRVVDRSRVAALEQAAVVEEDVDQLPEHVVEGLDQLLADERVLRLRLEAPLARPRPRSRSSSRRARGRARARRRPAHRPPRRGRSRSRCRSPRSPPRPDAAGLRPPRSARSPEAPACRRSPGWTNSTETWRASERAAGEPPERDQLAAGREPLGHSVTALGQAARVRGEEIVVGRVAPAQQLVDLGVGSLAVPSGVICPS